VVTVQELLKLDKSQLAYMIEKLYELDRLADIIIIDAERGFSTRFWNLFSDILRMRNN